MTAILAEKPLLAALAAREAWRRLRHLARTAPLKRWPVTLPGAGQLAVIPPSLRAGEALEAERIYFGRFTLAGQSVVDGRGSIFRHPHPSSDFTAELHAFEWLAHHSAAGHALAAQNARALVDDWMNEIGRFQSGPAFEPQIVARRLVSWFAHAEIVLKEAELSFYRRFLKSLAAQARLLRTIAPDAPDGLPRLRLRIALAYASLCLPSNLVRIRFAAHALAEELDRQIFPDGGHVSRDPSALVAILADLLPLRETYVSQGQPVPKGIYSAIDRMLPALRFFRQADGSLAHFNGTGLTDIGLVADLLRYDETLGEPIAHARHSGYHRLSAAGTVLLADTGCPPQASLAGNAHAGTLGFEFSSFAQPIVVNCGRPAGENAEWRRLARSTAAHSTLTLADHSSSRFAGSEALDRFLGTPLVFGPSEVAHEEEGHNGLGFTAAHNGYERSFGLLHERSVELSRDGRALHGRDRLRLGPSTATHPPALKGLQAALRFHLHPSVEATRIGHGVQLTAGDEVWVFDCDQGAEIEDSIFFADAAGPCRTTQIVVPFEARRPEGASWSFLRLR